MNRNLTRQVPLQSFFIRWVIMVLAVLCFAPTLRADTTNSGTSSFLHKIGFYSSKNGAVHRQYSEQDRVRYQLWDYTWKPDPDKPITRIEIRLGEQKVYVYQDDNLAAVSPTTTGKPGHDTPTGHYTILVKDIDHKSNLYGVFVDSNGYIVNDNANAGDKAPSGAVYDSADMPYYLRIREDGVGMHGGYLPGYPASHGCIRLPHAFAELLYSNVAVGTPVDVVP
jgi:lipoprotein-anchoring transpeptidase ErfK/SrfK